MRDRACSPEGYLRDAGGHTTRDPGVLAMPKGAIQPLGGDLGLGDRARALRRNSHDDAERRRGRDEHSRKGTDMATGDRARRASPNARGLSDHIRASPPSIHQHPC